MSYGITLSINTGAEEPFEVEWFNYTYNVWQMFEKAFGPERLQVLHERSASECIHLLEEAITYFHDNKLDLLPLNPSNGWGSYQGALEWLQKILAACRKHPLCLVTIT